MKNQLKLSDCVDAVANFHDAFKIKNEYSPKAIISKDDFLLRFNLMKEEHRISETDRHPNAKGHEVIANYLFEKLEGVL